MPTHRRQVPLLRRMPHHPFHAPRGQYAHDAQIAHDGRINDHLIVPPQVWAHFGVEQPYGASCGITLISDGRYTLHFFEPQCNIYYRFHGKEISREAFHTVNDREIPFDEYFRWHYAQCVMLHLRGTTADHPTVSHDCARTIQIPVLY
ncbi:BQ5605_C004g02832 [Microbotryum silenes-dioicae]|uniref:BQ5605_C004g02832 protein n=1 Tax=Microbotryum silenes-dioicae TaxID=796604 RepID=A0A2X0MW20_9BASI|nr:BQ5605_C004g02832 [Microbotryum silenes-dioicae]